MTSHQKLIFDTFLFSISYRQFKKKIAWALGVEEQYSNVLVFSMKQTTIHVQKNK